MLSGNVEVRAFLQPVFHCLRLLHAQWARKVSSGACPDHRRARRTTAARFVVAVHSALQGDFFCSSWPFGACWVKDRLLCVVGEYAGCHACLSGWLLVKAGCQSILLRAQWDSWSMPSREPGGGQLSLLRRRGPAQPHTLMACG